MTYEFGLMEAEYQSSAEQNGVRAEILYFPNRTMLIRVEFHGFGLFITPYVILYDGKDLSRAVRKLCAILDIDFHGREVEPGDVDPARQAKDNLSLAARGLICRVADLY